MEVVGSNPTARLAESQQYLPPFGYMQLVFWWRTNAVCDHHETQSDEHERTWPQLYLVSGESLSPRRKNMVPRGLEPRTWLLADATN